MYIQRSVSNTLLELAKQYPVITITGPRQSGKTTLCKFLFPDKPYVSLEDPDQREFATNDPHGFLARYPDGAILDEIQRVPSLTSYLQTKVDASKEKGLFMITGSQQFEVMSGITQSLAGRAALIVLLPFTYMEAYQQQQPTMEQCLYTGFYPRIFDESLDPSRWLSFYVTTYIERDVRQLLNIQDLSAFETFIRICAGRTGQVINYSAMGNDCGIDQKTVKKWLSVLEASYIIRLIQPFHKNINKRLTKAPKLYFLDVGLVCFLLGMRRPEHLRAHPLFGQIFETFVVGEILKSYASQVESARLFFYRDHWGHEVDMVFDLLLHCNLLEIKAGRTVNPDFFKSLRFLKEQDGIQVNKSFLVYGGEESYTREDVQLISWRDIDRHYIFFNT